jgi:hypothetical protein
MLLDKFVAQFTSEITGLRGSIWTPVDCFLHNILETKKICKVEVINLKNAKNNKLSESKLEFEHGIGKPTS